MTSTPSPLDEAIPKILTALSHDIDDVLKLVLEEVTDLRHTVTPGDIEDDPKDIHEQLITARRATDRVEELTAFTARIHAAAVRELNLRKQEIEDAEALALSSTTQNPWNTGDYATAKEKNASLLLATTDQRIAHRKAERRMLVLAEVLEFTRHCHRGLNDSRRDLDLRVRLISLQTSLEK